MQNDNLDIWWSSLTIAQKERIARKALSKASQDGTVDESLVRYPACTRWWNSLDEARKATIHDHCVDRHGYLLQEWNNAKPYGD
ncbi:MAG: hypothetical protein IJ701_00490 [Bacteroidales bacterium]|nr:hypothetical protein [Bacteroidales bacterium]